MSALDRFSPATKAWFEQAFAAPTPAQEGAWSAATEGDDALVVAPTGSGKTLAGFLWSLDRLTTGPRVPERERLRVLYISPLKALAVDVERNLRTPLTGIAAAASRLGLPAPDVRAAIRTGDTPQDERRKLATSPPDILITTPESLFLLLTSRAREALAHIETVIVDEIHALAGNKRGAHLALSLERLDHLAGKRIQRLGLSATVRPPQEVASFLSDKAQVIEVESDKRFDLSVVVPVEDMTAPGDIEVNGADPRLEPDEVELLGPSASSPEERTSIWPHVEERLVDLIRAHKSTIVFANSRRLAERLCARLNELAEEEIARAHHGSVSKEQRKVIEEQLKAGRLPAVVATSSLELGIDMGAVDLVVQVEAPDSVASGLQRIGRGGHQVGAVSRGVFFPKFRGDLLECTVVIDKMLLGEIEKIAVPRNPLDVLAQQVVGMVAMDDWLVDDLNGVVMRAAPFKDLPRSALTAVLDMLSGRYPSPEMAELRPRIKWDRATGRLSARPGSQNIAVTSGGTIPDRGLFGVFLAGEKGARVGELDEEMVYESRPGDTFVLGASTWLIEDIDRDRVLVTPAPGHPGKMPFWHGDALGRSPQLGAAIGKFTRELAGERPDKRLKRLATFGLDERAAKNLAAYIDEQKAATGALPDDRTLVVERFRDEVGDWRVCIHSPFGARVHSPWAQAIEVALGQRLGIDVQAIYTDDGIVLRLPEAEDLPDASTLVFDPEEIEGLVMERLGTSALFASRFRECAGRALLLPRRRPGSRTPLWQQRQKAARLLQVASRYESFPIVLETYRECLQDVFDLEALKDLMAAVAKREVRVVEVDTPVPSPFASSLQFGYVSAFMYEGDAPLAERRAQALSLDRSLLAEIMGREELRDLIDPEALQEVELDLQWLTGNRKARSPDSAHDALRILGDLSVDELRARSEEPEQADAWLRQLESDRRAVPLRVAGQDRWIAIEDAGRYRDALGAALPPGLPEAFLEPVPQALEEIAGRWAATHGPFVAEDLAARFGLGSSVVASALAVLEGEGRIVEGEFRPGGLGSEWIDVEVLRRVRRRSLAAYRREIEPAAPETLARFYLAWNGIGPASTRAPVQGPAALDALYEVVETLQGAPIPASVLEKQVLPARLAGYSASLLDELCSSGEVLWCGAGPIGSDDGWVVLATADRANLLLPKARDDELSDVAGSIKTALEDRGALFFRQIAEATGSTNDAELLLALWELVWAGWATNDTLVPLRALIGGGPRRSRSRRSRRGPAFPARMGPPSGAGRWSLVAPRDEEPTRRLHALAEQMLSRHGIVTRGAIGAERFEGGFAAIYPVFKAMEESGRCRRGYFVDGLGGAQFAEPGAVDRMRSLADPRPDQMQTEVLAATDPANPYGAALAWPERDSTGSGHRPGRKAGAVVVLVGGNLVLYVERGGRTLLSFSDGEDDLRPAVDALVLAVREGTLGRIAVERADGEDVFDSPFARVLTESGFRVSSRGLRLRA